MSIDLFYIFFISSILIASIDCSRVNKRAEKQIFPGDGQLIRQPYRKWAQKRSNSKLPSWEWYHCGIAAEDKLGDRSKITWKDVEMCVKAKCFGWLSVHTKAATIFRDRRHRTDYCYPGIAMVSDLFCPIAMSYFAKYVDLCAKKLSSQHVDPGWSLRSLLHFGFCAALQPQGIILINFYGAHYTFPVVFTSYPGSCCSSVFCKSS